VSAIAVSDLRKAYGQREVLHGLSFTVETGEVFALLGPNGAGKTTTVEILEGYRRRDGGDVRVLGVDPERGGRRFKARIGIVLQSSAVYQLLSVREIVALFAGYYPAPRPPDEVIELVGLAEKRGARVRTLSGGELRRLDLALALVGDPELVFLDEPTTGFDPAARRQAWDTIRDLRSLGKSILLTTHYMEEAQRLADRVAILRRGAIVGTGSPEELLSGHASVEIRYRRNGRELEDVYLELTREEASE
jgi:ABC-2 type transport system ATP-binding protein